MCELPNGVGVIKLGQITREETHRLLLKAGAKHWTDEGNCPTYTYNVPVTEGQREAVKEFYPKHWQALRGEVWIFLEPDAILCDGDVRFYDPVCRIHNIAVAGTYTTHPLCLEQQTEQQKSESISLAGRIRAAVAETAGLEGRL